MASAPISGWLCEPCKGDGKEIQAHTQCYECHELLCEPCSDYHMRLKNTKGHHLIELVQFLKKSSSCHDPSSSKQISTSVTEEELVSDFMEHVTLTEGTVLYQGVEVAIKSSASESKNPTTSRQSDPRQENATPSESSNTTTSRQSDPRQENATPSESSNTTTSRQSDPRREDATLSEQSNTTTSRQSDPRRENATPSEPSNTTTSKQSDPRREDATPSEQSNTTTSRQSDPRRENATPSEPNNTTTSRQSDPRGENATSSEPSNTTTSRRSDPRRENATPSEPSNTTTSRQSDPRLLTATKYLQYMVKRPDNKEKVSVTGVLRVSHNVVVVDNGNKVLKLFDQSGAYLSSTAFAASTLGITCVGDSTFATCGYSNTVELWTVRGNTVVSKDVYHVDDNAYSIQYNGTYYCVLHNDNNTITVLNRQGRQVKKIKVVDGCGKNLMSGCDIHMDNDTHHIYVPCWKETGVLCITVEGRALWFKPMYGLPWGITEIQGTLCVVNGSNHCLELITKEGEYVRKLLDKEDLGGQPLHAYYRQDGKLYVSYSALSDRGDKIDVYSVT